MRYTFLLRALPMSNIDNDTNIYAITLRDDIFLIASCFLPNKDNPFAMLSQLSKVANLMNR